MQALELFAYVLMALGGFYMVAIAAGAYLSFRYNLPFLGRPRGPEAPELPKWVLPQDED